MSLAFFLGFGSAGQTVHFRTETDKFLGNCGSGFALHLTQDSVVTGGIEGVVGFEIAGIKMFYCFTHILMEVVGFSVTAQRVRVVRWLVLDADCFFTLSWQ